MERYFLRMHYIGTRYRGAQKQVKSSNILDIDSIQGAIESALLCIKPKCINYPIVTLAGRTDCGVHALSTAAHVDLENYSGTPYSTENLITFLNRYLHRCGHEIRILSCSRVTNDFHARHSAKSRSYIYRFITPKQFGFQQIPLAEANRSFHCRFPKLDIDRIKEATKLFLGKRDFMTFCSETRHKYYNNNYVSYVRVLDYLRLEEAQPLMSFDPNSNHFQYWHITVKSRGFLYNQVRRIVGALLNCGAGRLSEKQIMTMLQVPNHKNWNPATAVAPPYGLYLTNVEYDPEFMEKVTIVDPPSIEASVD